jgi:hypothetical protein
MPLHRVRCAAILGGRWTQFVEVNVLSDNGEEQTLLRLLRHAEKFIAAVCSPAPVADSVVGGVKNLDPLVFATGLQRKDPKLPFCVVVPNALVAPWGPDATTVVEGTVDHHPMGRRAASWIDQIRRLR